MVFRYLWVGEGVEFDDDVGQSQSATCEIAISMPRAPHPSKVTCRSCGWHLIVTDHGSDVMNSWAAKWDSMFNTVPGCGRCGGTEFTFRAATLMESVNPVECGRKLVYMARRQLKKEEVK